MSSGYPSNWDELRKKVYKRDNYTCKECGVQGGSNGNAELHAHHVVPRSEGGSDKISNLTTLCSSCHSEIHGRPLGNSSNISKPIDPTVTIELQLDVMNADEDITHNPAGLLTSRLAILLIIPSLLVVYITSNFLTLIIPLFIIIVGFDYYQSKYKLVKENLDELEQVVENYQSKKREINREIKTSEGVQPETLEELKSLREEIRSLVSDENIKFISDKFRSLFTMTGSDIDRIEEGKTSWKV